MFCPNCGRDNSFELKFCASCGTNLEVISRALSVREEGLFTKLDKSLDQFIARYAEHVLKDAPIKALDQKIISSWQVLGQGVLTSLFDIALFTIMTIVLPVKLAILLIYTPVRLLAERSNNQRRNSTAETETPILFDELPRQWMLESVPSITEHTTVNLGDSGASLKKAGRKTDPLREDRA